MNSKVSQKYFGLLAAVFGIITIAGFLLLFLSYRHMKRLSQAEQYAWLSSYGVELKNRFQEVERFVNQVQVSALCQTIAQADNPLANPEYDEEFQRLHNILASSMETDRFIENIAIHFLKSDVVFTANELFLASDQYYGKVFRCENYSLHRWINETYSQDPGLHIYPAQPITLNGDTANRIILRETILSHKGDTPVGAITIFINEDSLLAQMNEVLALYGGYGFLLWNNEVIAASDPTATIETLEESGDYIPIELFSDFAGLSCFFILSSQGMPAQVKTFLIVGVSILCSSAIISLLLSVRFLSRRLFFLNETLDFLCYREKRKSLPNELEFLHSTIHCLVKQNEVLQEKAAQLQSALKKEFWENLIRGKITTLHEANYYLQQMDNIEMDRDYAVVVLRIRGIGKAGLTLEQINRLNRMKLYLDDQLKRNISSYVYGYNESPRSLVLIHTSPENPFDFLERLNGIAAKFHAIYHYRLQLYFGPSVPRLLDLFLSFHNATASIETDFSPQGLPPGQIADDPLTLTHKANLIQLLKSGQDQEFDFYLEKIFDNNFPDGPQSRSQYIHALLSTLLLAYNELSHLPTFPHERFSQLIGSAYRSTDLEEQQKLALEARQLFSRSVTPVFDHTGSPLLEKVIPFIQKNVSNYNLSLEMVADHFNVSKSYLSAHFKERSGENFSNYVEALRIRASCELMRQGEYTVNEIAQQIGYSSAQVFRRAFRRVMGVSPTEYMKNCIKNPT